MIKMVVLACALLACALLLPIFAVAAVPHPASSLQDLIRQHLDSIGDAKARSEIKTRVAQGPAHYKILVGGGGELDGKSVFASEGNEIHFMMKFPNNLYQGEQFITDGKKVEVSGLTASKNRSAFGQFVYVHDEILKEGLVGGVLSTAWPLLNLEERNPKLNYEGVKTVDGQEFHVLAYRPHKGSDVDIHLYFDTETFHHVMTVYTLNVSIGIVGRETGNAQQQETHYRMEERFSNFKTIDGITLPTHYVIHFSRELQSGRTSLTEWSIEESDLGQNVSLDPKNFVVR